MRLFLLTTLTMIAFAANSVLNRLALKGGLIDALDFAAIRLGSGALALAILSISLGRPMRFSLPDRTIGAGALLVYVLGFSMAYVSLDAGVGALVLFGGVQITMFVGAVTAREVIPATRWVGAGLAFSGLVWLARPGTSASADPAAVLAMAAAAVGWGIYSLAGRRGGDPLAGTAANFAVAAPLSVIALFLVGADAALTLPGVVLAIVSGVVTSGLGYALWYHVLPDLGAARAGAAQLSVPVIAVAGGMVFLSEPLTLPLLVAMALVLGGVALAVLPRQ